MLSVLLGCARSRLTSFSRYLVNFDSSLIILCFRYLAAARGPWMGSKTLVGGEIRIVPLPGYLNATKKLDPAPFLIGATLIILD